MIIYTSKMDYCRYLDRANKSILYRFSDQEKSKYLLTYEEFVLTIKTLKLQWDMINPYLRKQRLIDKLIHNILKNILRDRKSRFKNLTKSEISLIVKTLSHRTKGKSNDRKY